MRARARSIPLLLAAVLSLATAAQAAGSRAAVAPGLSGPDRIRIAEARRALATVGEDVWPGWGRTPLPVLLVTRGGEYLVFHPNPDTSFVRSGYDSLLGSEVFTRKRVFGIRLQATFPAVGGVPTVVIGQPKFTEASHSTRWLLTLLHEHFHQLQQTQPDYYESAAALDLARGDSSGMWMLDYPFPYDDRRVNEAFTVLCRALREVVEAIDGGGFEKKLGDYLEARGKFKAALDESDYRYFSFQLWQEGIARHTEYRLARRLAALYRPTPEFRALHDFIPFENEAQRIHDHILLELRRANLKKERRTAFYHVGAAEGMLLDRARPAWRERYFKEKFFLEKYF